MFRSCCLLIVLFILASCASQLAPTGGDKDITPPAVVKENPENLSTHFNSSKINLTFSEFVTLNDAANQIFFSPAPPGRPEFRIHGKTLTITLPDSLRSNTTYTINFGSAIKDIREGNIMLDYQYVFSTGAVIDSFRIQGRVTNASDGKSKQNLNVLLHSDLSDSSIAKNRPDYNARTDSSGRFILDHLHDGTFRLFALDDQDFNLLYNQPGEQIAFLDQEISVHDTSSVYSLTLFRPVPFKQSVLSSFSRQPGKVSIAFAKATEHIQISPLDKNLKSEIELNATRDTVTIWTNDLKSDSLSFSIHDKDFSDTVRARMKLPDNKRTSLPKLTILSLGSKARGSVQIIKSQPFLFEFSVPAVAVTESEKLTVIHDSSKKSFEISPGYITDSVTRKIRGSVVFNFVQGENYTLLIPDSFYRDLTGNYNDTTKIHFHIYGEEDLGTCLLNVSFSDSASSKKYFYEFRNSQGILISKESLQTHSTSLKFNSLPPGNYIFKVVEDRNNNSSWDTGNYWQHLQPEKIFIFNEAITVRANWDIELKMKIDNR